MPQVELITGKGYRIPGFYKRLTFVGLEERDGLQQARVIVQEVSFGKKQAGGRQCGDPVPVMFVDPNTLIPLEKSHEV